MPSLKKSRCNQLKYAALCRLLKSNHKSPSAHLCKPSTKFRGHWLSRYLKQRAVAIILSFLNFDSSDLANNWTKALPARKDQHPSENEGKTHVAKPQWKAMFHLRKAQGREVSTLINLWGAFGKWLAARTQGKWQSLATPATKQHKNSPWSNCFQLSTYINIPCEFPQIRFPGTSWYSCCIVIPGVWFPASNWELSWEYGAWMWESMAYFAYCWRNQLSIVEDIVSDHIKITKFSNELTDQPLGPVDPSAAGKRQDLFAGQHVTRGYQAAICKTCFNSFQNISRIWLRWHFRPFQPNL